MSWMRESPTNRTSGSLSLLSDTKRVCCKDKKEQKHVQAFLILFQPLQKMQHHSLLIKVKVFTTSKNSRYSKLNTSDNADCWNKTSWLLLSKSEKTRLMIIVVMMLFNTPETSIVHLPECLHREWVWRLDLGLLHSWLGSICAKAVT